MRRVYALAPLLTTAVLAQAAPMPEPAAASLAGHWQGALSADGAVQLISVDLTETPAGLAGTYDIPELGFFEMPLDSISRQGRKLELELLYGSFTGTWHTEIDELAAVRTTETSEIRLHLKRSVRPPGCTAEDVQFESDGVQLAGTILRPERPGPHPAAVILHDAARRHRRHRSYRTYGEIYCRAGIASLIYDKRGAGESEGDFDAASLDDLTADAVAAYSILERDSEVSARHIGFIGFSQGGWVGPAAASQVSTPAFVVMVAGPAVSVWEQEAHRVEYTMRDEDFDDTAISAALRHTELVFATARDPGLWPKLRTSVVSAAASPWAEHVDLPDTVDDATSWLLEDYDPRPVLGNTTVPLLAIFGELDRHVPPAENVAELRQHLTSAGNTNFEIVVIPALAHRIYTGASQVGDGGFPNSLRRWDRLVPGLFETIVPWTLSQVDVSR